MINNISKRINSLFIFFSICFCIITIFFNIYVFDGNVNSISLKNATKKIEERNKVIDEYFNRITNDIKYIKYLIENNISEDKIFNEKAYKNLEKFLSLNSEISDLNVIDMNANYLFQNKKSDILDFKDLLLDFNSLKKEFTYSSIKKYENKLYFNVLSPIYFNDKIVSFLFLEFDLNKFLKRITNTPLYDVYVFKDNGIVFYQNFQEIFMNKFHIENIIKKDNQEIMKKDLVITDSFISKKFDTPFKEGFNFLVKTKKVFVKDEYINNLSKVSFFILSSVLFFGFLFYLISRITKSHYETINRYQKKLHEHSLETLSDYILYSKTNLKGKITYASSGFCKLSGYTKDELLGKPHNIIRHEATDDELFKEMWENIQKGQIWTGELQNRKKNGEAYWVRANVAPDYDEAGNHIGYVSIRENITDAKKLQKKNNLLNDSIQYTQKLIELSDEGNVITDDKLNIINFNFNAKKLFEEIYYSKIFLDILEKYNSLEAKKLSNKFKYENIKDIDDTFIFNTENKYLKFSIKRLKENQILFIIVDITKYIKQKVYFENILNTSKSIILTLKNDKLVSANRTFFNTLDYKNIDDFNTKNESFGDIFISKLNYIFNSFDNHWHDQIKENRKNNLKTNNICILDKDNNEKVFHIESSGKIYEKEDEELFILTDITKIEENRKLLEIQTKNAAMGEMVAMIAHQWRQPLTVLISLLTRLNISYKSKMINDEMFDEVYSKSSEIVHHLSKTINDFKNYFKNEDKKENVTVNFLIENSIKFFKDSFKNNKIEFVSQLNEFDNKEIYINSSLLTQILINLIKNSIDAHKEFISEGKFIKVDIKFNDEYLLIQVQDNAGGIPEDIINRIFEPYFSTKSLNGTGLGLYMCRVIIEDNFSGSINAENTENGANFKLKIKLNKEENNV